MNDSETLLCQEDETCLNENNYKLGLCSVSECDDEYIQTLIRREAVTFQSNSTFSLLKSEKSWFKCARLDVIKWILNVRFLNLISYFCSYLLLDIIIYLAIKSLCIYLQTRAFFGFHFRTAYLSLIYFDEFFSKRSIDVSVSYF